MISQDIIDRINDLPILDVCQKIGLEVKKKGVNHQANCPFHNEKTGSFVVSPGKNIFKCFGCGEGGGPIKLVQKYEKKDWIESVKFLAKAFNIDIPREPMTEEQTREYKEREVLTTVNEACQKYFLENLTGNALDYVKSRWDNKSIEQWGIGFAPDEWHGLDEWSRKNALKRDALINAGLLSQNDEKKVYDTFRNRIMFPVHNHYGRIIGFSGRILGDGLPKYINTKETASFIKNQALFGIFLAYKSIREKGFAYLVEGGPDVIKMHHVGAENTVAPLGTSLTENHLIELKRYCKSVCFVLETDDAGIKAVIRNAKMAVKLGFTVSVLALPEEFEKTGERVKHDPDSFFRTKEQFQKYIKENTHDFIIWYSTRTLNTGDQNNRAKAIDDICELLAKQSDKGTLEYYLHNLSAMVKPKRMWVQKVQALTKDTEVKEEKQRIPKSIDSEHFDMYGFYEEDNQVFFATKSGISRGSNFTLKPLFHVASVTNSKRLYLMTNYKGFQKTIELNQEDLIALSKFRKAVESHGNFLWELGENELNRYKRYLYEQTDTCYEISQLGWQKEGFWAWGNGIYNGNFTEVDSYGIVKHNGKNWYLPAFSKIWDDEKDQFQFEHNFIFKSNDKISLYDYAKQFVKVNGNNGIIGLSYLFSALFRDIIISTTRNFPILFLFGPKGSGKSQMGESIMSFFIADVIKNKAPNLNNSTISAINHAISRTCNAITHLDEFKNDLDLIKIELLKGIYDGTGRTRMNMDKDKKSETTSVDSAILVSGQEMPTVDIALFNRLVFLAFHKTMYTEAEKKDFEKLKAIEEQGLTHLTNEILAKRDLFKKHWLDNYNEVSTKLQNELRDSKIEDRTFRNWLIVASTYKTIEPILKLSISYSEVEKICVEGILSQNTETKRNNEVQNFWNMVEYFVKDGLIENEVDYYIKRVRAVKTDKIDAEWVEEKTILILNHTKVFQLYRKHGKLSSDKILPLPTLTYYLQYSKEYLGIKKSQAFKNRDAVTRQISEGTDSTGLKKTKYQVTNAYVFLYEPLNISIDYILSTDDVQNKTDFSEVIEDEVKDNIPF